MNKIYIVVMEGEVDGDRTVSPHNVYFVDEASAIKFMLKECQKCYDDWRGNSPSDVFMDVDGQNCLVNDGVSGDYKNWKIVCLNQNTNTEG